jgi:hypothetical protein
MVQNHFYRGPDHGSKPFPRDLTNDALGMVWVRAHWLDSFVVRGTLRSSALARFFRGPNHGSKPFPTDLANITLGRVLVWALRHRSSDTNVILSVVLHELCACCILLHRSVNRERV